MNLVVRVDASLAIGIGHVMRCLALADALRAEGAHCRFVVRSHPGHLIAEIRRRGHAVIALPMDDGGPQPGIAADGPAHAAWLGADWLTDAQQTELALGDAPVDWLIVDHYAIDARWQRALRGRCRRLMVIDDLADRTHDCDLLLDQNLGRSAADYAGLAPVPCITLIGPGYALLRPEFAKLRPYSLERRATAGLTRMLIAMGGVDRDNATGRVLQALSQCTLPAHSRVSVVMGAHAPWLQQVREQATRLSWASEVLVDLKDMARLMADSDLAIGAAGTSAWERCCLGLPTMAIVLAPNQQAGASALAAAGAIVLLRDDGDLAGELGAALATVRCAEVLRGMQTASASVTDGQGARRLARELFHGLA